MHEVFSLPCFRPGLPTSAHRRLAIENPTVPSPTARERACESTRESTLDGRAWKVAAMELSGIGKSKVV